MLSVKKILFPTDYSACAEGAFSQAAYLADRFDAELHVLHVLEGPARDLSETLDAFFLDEDEVASQLHMKRPGASPDRVGSAEIRSVQVQVRGDSASDNILEYAVVHDVDLIVMATHGRHGVDRLLSGSVAEQVVRQAACPVLTVHACDGLQRHIPVRRILVPVDFSDHAHATLAYARQLAAAYGARLGVLHVIREEVLPYVYGMDLRSIMARGVRAHTTEALQHWIAGDLQGSEAPELHVIFGRPDAHIAPFAEAHDYDLIVTATHGRTGLRRFVMGSVAERLVRDARCPVFIVKSFGKSLLRETTGTGATLA